MICPEIRQYFVEGDDTTTPFDRNHRVVAYQKGVMSTMAFGTRRNVNEIGHEWINHSLYLTEIEVEQRVLIGKNNERCAQPYSLALLNISAMSYGALSDRAVSALSGGAKLGGFLHSTGEHGLSDFQKEGGADLVWNIGTAFFGCGKFVGGGPAFDPDLFTKNSAHEKMVEIKLSQGAKLAHGKMLPEEKISPAIAKARNLEYPILEDCHSPTCELLQ